MDRVGAGSSRRERLGSSGGGQDPGSAFSQDGPPPASSGREELYWGSTIEGRLQGGQVEEGGMIGLESWEQTQQA